MSHSISYLASVAAFLGGTVSIDWKIYGSDSCQCVDHGLPELPHPNSALVQFGLIVSPESVVYVVGGEYPWHTKKGEKFILQFHLPYAGLVHAPATLFCSIVRKKYLSNF